MSSLLLYGLALCLLAVSWMKDQQKTRKAPAFSISLFFLGAWSTAKLPLLTFEAANMGTRFMLLRLVINIPGILCIAWLTEHLSDQRTVFKC